MTDNTDDTKGTQEAPDPCVFLPEAVTQQRYKVSDMTLDRWTRDESLGFPKPIYIRGRKSRRLAELEAFEERQAKDPRATRWAQRGCVGTSDEAA